MPNNWIRGVNLGGWLVLERFITPYLFALTTCHLAGNPCYYPGQIGAPINASQAHFCHSLKDECKPVLVKSPITGELDYPVDEYTLLQQFADVPLVEKNYLQHHYEHFLTRQDVVALARAGVTHVRVPLPQSILLDSDAWLYFLRLVGWCREFDIQVWPDLVTTTETAQQQQHGGTRTCHDEHNMNLNRTLHALQTIAVAIHNDGIKDVVTGIGIRNNDCDDDEHSMQVMRDYNRKALRLVRNVLGNTTSIIIGDMSNNASRWDDGFWQDTPHTYLDSHYYHVFAENTRALSPKQHIALLCGREERAVADCCYQDHVNQHKKPTASGGISRLVGEWSAAFDSLPFSKLEEVMHGIRETGKAPDLHRNLTQARRNFMENFVKAQMVVYEAADVGVSSGWFYWNVKMEGGAFAEWDFLRGIREKWIPEIPARNVSSEDMYGTCQDILHRTKDDESIVHEYPDPKTTETWEGPPLDDDYAISHGDSLNDKGEAVESKVSPVKESEQPTTKKSGNDSDEANDEDDEPFDNADDDKADDDMTPKEKTKKKGHPLLTLIFLGFFGFAIKKVFFSPGDHRRGLGYSSVHGTSSGEAVMMAV